MPKNVLNGSVRVLQGIVVPNADHPKPLRLEPGRALLIPAHRTGVLTAVDLDDQSSLQAQEVHDIRSDRSLSAKLHAELAKSKPRPQTALSVRQFLSQLARPQHAHNGGA